MRLLFALASIFWASVLPSGAAALDEPGKQISKQTHRLDFVFDELTWSSVDVSPDGRSYVFDALGDLFIMDVDDGTPRLLRGGADWDMMPRFSPDGRRILFASNRGGGAFAIWSISPGGSQLVEEIPSDDGNDILFPVWDSLCGGAVGQSRYATGSQVDDTNKIGLKWRPADTSRTCKEQQLLAGAEFPDFTPDASKLYFSRNGRIESYDRVSANTAEVALPRNDERLFSPRLSADGRLLAFGSTFKGDASLRLLDLRSGEISELMKLDGTAGRFNMLPGYAFDPNGKSLVVITDRHLKRIDIVSKNVVTIPIRVRFTQDMPAPPVPKWTLDRTQVSIQQAGGIAVSADQRVLTFSSAGRIWRVDLNAGRARQIDEIRNGRSMSPALSPDGKRLAYTRWRAGELGELAIASTSSTHADPQIVGRAGLFSNPAWSHDGTKIAMLEWHPKNTDSVSVRDGQIDLVLVDLGTGTTALIKRDIQTASSKNHPVMAPVFSKDDSELYYVEGRLSEQGRIVNEISRVTLDTATVTKVLTLPASRSNVIEIAPALDLIAFGNIEELRVASFSALVAKGDIDAEELDAVSTATKEGHGADTIAKCGTAFCWTRAAELFELNAEGETSKLGDFGQSLPRPTTSGMLALVGADVITMDGGKILSDQVILIKGGRIVQMGDRASVRISKKATRIDVAGLVVMPGYVDTHAHPFSEGDMDVGPLGRPAYRSNLAYGVTTTAELSGSLGAMSDGVELELGDAVGPRLLSVGYPIFGYRDFALTPSIESYNDALRYVRTMKAHGAFAIKSYEVARHDSRRWIVDASRAENMPVYTHYSPSLWSSAVAVSEGHSGIEHLTGFPNLGNDWARFFAASGSTWTPTLFRFMYADWSPKCNLWASLDDVPEKAKRFVPATQIARQVGKSCTSNPPPYLDWVQGMREINAAGGNVSMGAHGELNGPDVHAELKALVDGGFSPLQALETYTSRGARKLGVENEIGKIAPGYLADLQILNANPLENISNSTDIKYVMVRGILYDAETVHQVWPALLDR